MQVAGTIGTGLFLGSGSALRGAGPLGALIAYILVGTVAYSYVQVPCISFFRFPTLTTLSTPPTRLQLTVRSWGNDGVGAHLRHFPTLRLVPYYSTRGGEAERHVR